nr:hypothetical protein [Rhizobium lentis]
MSRSNATNEHPLSSDSGLKSATNVSLGTGSTADTRAFAGGPFDDAPDVETEGEIGNFEFQQRQLDEQLERGIIPLSPGFFHKEMHGFDVKGIGTGGPMAGGRTSGSIGRDGEAAVRAKVDIGEKQKITVNGRVRIPDGITRSTLSEVKKRRKTESYPAAERLHRHRDISRVALRSVRPTNDKKIRASPKDN